MKSAGGFSSLFYSVKVAKKVGFKNFFKSISSKNTCKTCGLGMGGQKGGMHNETGHFPEICKKSIQAQLTDIQREIPLSTFRSSSIEDLKKIPAKELEALGRINHPLYKNTNDTHYYPIPWYDAIKIISDKLKKTLPNRTFFYSSGRSSNEAAFILQLFARLYGTNNVNNCSFYCHQASGAGLSSTIGTSTATIQLEDIRNSDLIFVIGANPSSNHPRFVNELVNCNRRGGKVIVINPAKEPGLVKFTIPSDVQSMLSGGSIVATEYLQPNIGADIALLKGIAKFVIEKNAINTEFVTNYTNGFEDYKKDILNTSWDVIIKNSGITKDNIERTAGLYMYSQNTVFAWSMGITQHKHGVENVESIVNLALLRGMIGKKSAGLLPLRGHSNVQGLGTVGVTPSLKEKVFENIESKMHIKLPVTPGMDTMSSVHASYKGEIDFAFLLGGNLYAATPDSAYVEKALSNIPFKVFLNTTLNKGHLYGSEKEMIILPVAARDEEKQATTQESMFSFVRMSDGGIVRLNNVKSEVDIICDIAINVLEEKKLKFSEFKNHSNIRKAIAAVIPEMEKLNNIDLTKEEFHINGRAYHTPEFRTANKKANFKVVPIPEPKRKQGEFNLMSIRSEGQFNTIIYDEEDTFRSQTERWIVLMCKDDIESMGLKENDSVTLKSETGKMESVKVKTFNIAKGNVMAYYPEANVLISTDIDNRSKTPSFKSVVVKIT